MRTSSVILVKLLLVLIVVSLAATSSISPVSYTGEVGGLNKTSNQLLTTAKGFSKTTAASAVGNACGSNVTFGSGTLANTALVNGNVIFDVQVNTTATATANTCFTVTFYLATSIGSQTQYGPVYLATGGSVTAGQAIDCKFDLGSSSLPTPPFSYKLAVQ